MYNYNSNVEEREGFPWKKIIIGVLIVILVIFLLFWLMPGLNSNSNNEGQPGTNLEPFYNQVYLDNLDRMHNAAKNYYTVDRLPKKVGDKVTMTLGEMLEKKLLVEFTDGEGNTCDKNASYVEVTKYENEYALVTYLNCGDRTEQIVEYLGCKDLCSLNQCETTEIIKPTTTPSPTPSTPDKNPSKDEDKTPTPVVKKYKYEYKRAASIVYSKWSDWSNATAIKDGQKITFGLSSDKLTEYRSAGSKKLLAGYEVSYNKEKPIFKTTYDNLIGYYTLKVCEEYNYIVTGNNNNVYQVGNWVSQGIAAYDVSPSDTANTKYVLIKTTDSRCDEECKYSTKNYYEKFTRTTTNVGTTSSVKVTCAKYDSERVPVYGTRITFAGYEKIKTPLYLTVDLYQVRTRTITKKITADTKWSTSSSDKTLLNSGYKLTGKRIEI